jgi:hypothetical protein
MHGWEVESMRLLEQHLLSIAEPYSVVKIEYVAQQVGQVQTYGTIGIAAESGGLVDNLSISSYHHSLSSCSLQSRLPLTSLEQVPIYTD